MKVEIDRVAEVVTKRAESDTDADRLRQEAQVLDAARHPGIIQWLGPGPGPDPAVTLRSRLVAARPLAALSGPDRCRLGPAEVALVGAAAAATLADLHDLGIVHGGVSADHILVDDRHRPVLCSLGRGGIGVGTGAGGPGPADDVAGLAGALLSCLPPGPGSCVPGLHSILVRATRGDLRRPTTARRLADQLALITAQASGPSPPAGPGGLARLGCVLAVAAGAAALAAAASLVLRPGTTRHGAAGPLICPAVDLGCRPVPHPDGVVTTGHGRYLIGAPGDRVVIGRWRCSRPLPALLPRAGGDVWAFDRWPAAGLKIAGRLVAHVDGAVSLAVEPAAGGCDRVVVGRRVGPAVDVDPAHQPP